MIIYPERSFCSLLRSRPQPGLTGDIYYLLSMRETESNLSDWTSVTSSVRMEKATVIVVLAVALILALVINLMFTMYHLYLRSNSNYRHCDLGQPGEPLCVDSLTLSTYQVLIVLTLLAYLAVLSDLATGKIKKLLAGTGLAQIRERIRKLLSRGNNSVSPVEEFDLNDIPVSVEYQESGNSHQNSQCIAILKDHIR